MKVNPEDILAFWFAPQQRRRWYATNAAFDAEIREHFLAVYEAACAHELDSWRDAPRSLLALIIVLDQFPRNMFRGSPRAFATDPEATELVKMGVQKGFHHELSAVQRDFFVMPLMHSEDLADHELLLQLTIVSIEPESHYAREHRETIARFGRFPHRNKALGRQNTAEEEAYLQEQRH